MFVCLYKRPRGNRTYRSELISPKQGAQQFLRLRSLCFIGYNITALSGKVVGSTPVVRQSNCEGVQKPVRSALQVTLGLCGMPTNCHWVAKCISSFFLRLPGWFRCVTQMCVVDGRKVFRSPTELQGKAPAPHRHKTCQFFSLARLIKIDIKTKTKLPIKIKHKVRIEIKLGRKDPTEETKVGVW